jgi:hypothetical protein
MSTIRIVEQRNSYFLEAGRELLDPSQPADLQNILTLLSVPDAAWDLANNRQAGAVIELVKAMKPEQQATVLSAPNAAWGLANNRQAGAVIELVKAMPFEQQAAVLSAHDAVRGLADNGEAGAVIELVKAMPLEQQAAVLSARNAARRAWRCAAKPRRSKRSDDPLLPRCLEARPANQKPYLWLSFSNPFGVYLRTRKSMSCSAVTLRLAVP